MSSGRAAVTATAGRRRTPAERDSPIVSTNSSSHLTLVMSIGVRERVPCRGLGSGWLTERFHGNGLVTHVQDDQIFCSPRRLESYAVARCRLHQRAPQRRHPTDVVAVEI